MRFKDKIVLITGASRGIGRATAVEFAKEGATVIVNYVASESSAKSVVKQIESLGGTAIAVKCDVSDEIQVKKMIELVLNKFKRLDILVNNAGIVMDLPFTERTLKHWKKTFEVNMEGTFLCSKYASVPMLKQKSGSIINVSSSNGINTGDPTSTDYDATKAAIISFTKNMAQELAPNIRVNCLAPGWVDTDMNKSVPKEYIKEAFNRQAIKRFSTPEEQAKAILFLASDDASYITGSVLVVDGGHR